MGRSRSKLKAKRSAQKLNDEIMESKVPIPNLPEKFLWMHVKSGTRINCILGRALTEFPNYNCVVWSATSHGIEKAISCVELFKRKQEGLHQITKLRYVESEKSTTEKKTDANVEARFVPEIHILLARETPNTSEPGYQAPNDCGEFLNQQIEDGTGSTKRQGGSDAAFIYAKEFAAMELKTGQKRPKTEQQAEAPPKKNKKKGNGNR